MRCRIFRFWEDNWSGEAGDERMLPISYTERSEYECLYVIMGLGYHPYGGKVMSKDIDRDDKEVYGTLMEYTGLDDIHNEGIWEGDIIKFAGEKTQLGVVEFSEYAFRVNGSVLCDLEGIEVVGNIFQHKHILEGELADD